MPLPKRGRRCRCCWRWIWSGFFEEDDFLEPRFAVGDDQIGADLVAGSQRFGLFGNGDHVAHGHRGHQSWNVAVFYGDQFFRQFKRDHFGLDGVVLLFGLAFTSRQNGNQDSRSQHHGRFPASHWSLTPSYDSHKEGRGGKSLLEEGSTSGHHGSRATVTNENGSELGRKLRAGSSSEFRRR